MLDKDTEALLYFVKLGLGGDVETYSIQEYDWNILKHLSSKHGITAIVEDGMQCLYKQGCSYQENVNDKQIRLQMFAQTMAIERQYQLYEKEMTNLLAFYRQHGVKTLLLKGYGLSLNYPNPAHRPPGDIDLYHFGYGGKADDLLWKELNIRTKQNEDKHSTFVYKGLSVENHAVFVNDECHPSLHSLECFFEEDANNAIPYTIRLTEGKNVSVFFPSITTNALFIPLHLGEHFVHGEASLRQVCDWYCFVKAHHSDIDWTLVEKKSKEAGFFEFLGCLNTILIKYIGADATWLPQWKCDMRLVERVFNEILYPSSLPANMSLWDKTCKFFASNWKFKLVYCHENILMASLRQARAYRRVKWNKDGMSIWEKNKQ